MTLEQAEKRAEVAETEALKRQGLLDNREGSLLISF